MQFVEAKQELSRKLDIEYSDIANNGLFTDTDLGEWLNLGVLRAWDYKPWPFTEGAKTITTISAEYYDYPDGLMEGSAYLIMVGGKCYRKLLFKDYLKFKEDYPNDDDKVWAEHKTYIFINQKSYTVGNTLDVFGKLKSPKLSATSDPLPFSPIADNNEYSGNQAIVLLAYAEALGSEKKKNPTQARQEEKRAFEILDLLWKPFAEQNAMKQVDQPFFNVPNYFGRPNSVDNLGNFD